MAKARVKKGYMVVVISGKDRDLTTPRRVLQVDPSKNRVLVEGVNMVKRHTRPNPQRNNQGGIVEREAMIDLWLQAAASLEEDSELETSDRIASVTPAIALARLRAGGGDDSDEDPPPLPPEVQRLTTSIRSALGTELHSTGAPARSAGQMVRSTQLSLQFRAPTGAAYHFLRSPCSHAGWVNSVSKT